MGRMTKLMARMRPVGVHIGVLGIAVVCTLGTSAQAQNGKMTPIAIPAQPDAIGLRTVDG